MDVEGDFSGSFFFIVNGIVILVGTVIDPLFRRNGFFCAKVAVIAKIMQ